MGYYISTVLRTHIKPYIMLRLVFCICILFCSSFVHGQKEAANWYFGNNAGVNFNGTTPNALTDGKLNTNEGCATISNNRGELLFYTDGIKVWDKNHNVMPNGQGLLGNPSSTQSAIIVPKPLSNSIYYIFTVTDAAKNDGLRYSEVDMELNNGNGAVTSNKNVLLTTPCAEKITAVQNANGKDFWVITHSWDNADFLSFKVNGSGINVTPVKSTIGSIHGGETGNSAGYMKASPNGKKIAIARWNIDSLVEIFDFNNTTGILTNPLSIDNFFGKDIKNGAYGIEFSPNSNILYVSDLNLYSFSSKLYQFDLSSNNKKDIIDSNTIIYSGSNLLSAIQLALDGKIYISNSVTSTLDIIENPNEIGFACSYKNRGLNLGGKYTIYGLPPFIQSFFVAKIETSDVCFGSVNSFKIDTDEPIDNIQWNFGDGFTSNDISPNHLYDAPGVYTITATMKSGVNTYNLETQIEIFENPIIDMQTNWVICDNQPITLFLNSTHDAYQWSTGENSPSIIVDKAGVYNITVFNSNSNNTIICESSIDVIVSESGLPDSIEIMTYDWAQKSASILIDVNGIGSYEYSLDSINYQNDNTFYNLSSGYYVVYVRDKNGCGYIEREVQILNYPKFFTPNGDGIHDTWNIVGLQSQLQAEIHVYDRYGKLIKQLSPNSLGWNGTYNGNPMPNDDYWFTVMYTEPRDGKMKLFKSHFTLKR